MTNKTYPDRVVLEGVPRVGFYGDVRNKGGKPWPEDVIFPSCLRSILEYHGDTENDYVKLMGVSGAGWFLNWGGWTGDNVALYYMSADLGELFTRTFNTIGYGTETAPCSQPPEHSDDILALIKREINAGRPVLSHGVVGPPETSIIAGYDEGGKVLIGWSFFQNNAEENPDLEFEDNGYFRKRDWEAVTWDAFTVGERFKVPDPKQQFRDALKWGLTVANTPRTFQERPNGIAAYGAWIESLTHEDEIANFKPGCGYDDPFVVHRDAVGVVAENRWYLSDYLGDEIPDCMAYQASYLYAAASCYAREHELMWELWANEAGMGHGPEQRAAFADPAVRKRSIDIIKQARDLDIQGAAHIEEALEKDAKK